MSPKSIFSFNNIESPLGNWMEEIEAQREAEQLQRLEEDRIKSDYNLKNPILFNYSRGDSAIIYSQLGEDGVPLYSKDQLEIAAKAATNLDNQENLYSLGYKVVDVRDLKSGKISIDPFNTYWEVSLGNGGKVMGNTNYFLDDPTDGAIDNANVVCGQIYVRNILHLGADIYGLAKDDKKLFMNVGATINHEANIHGVRSVISQLAGGDLAGDGDLDHAGHGGMHGGVSGVFNSILEIHYSEYHKKIINLRNNALTHFILNYKWLQDNHKGPWLPNPKDSNIFGPFKIPHEGSFGPFISEKPILFYRNLVEGLIPYRYPPIKGKTRGYQWYGAY
jgi:hypothetical protein